MHLVAQGGILHDHPCPLSSLPAPAHPICHCHRQRCCPPAAHAEIISAAVSGTAVVAQEVCRRLMIKTSGERMMMGVVAVARAPILEWRTPWSSSFVTGRQFAALPEAASRNAMTSQSARAWSLLISMSLIGGKCLTSTSVNAGSTAGD